jgi:hypothetical protein
VAERNEKVMEYVKGELEKDPKISLASLYEGARKVDASIGELNPRQFHARYPLQIKRRSAAAGGAKRSGGRKASKRSGRRGAAKKAGGAQQSAATPNARRARRGGQAAGGSERDQLRTLFLEFASDFSQAESRSEIVRFMSNVESYVDRAEKLVSR